MTDAIRAALAQPEPEVVGPTDQQIADAFAEGCRDGSKAGEPPFLGGARAVLAAEADGPAVQSREPASITQQSTNMPDWRGLCEELIEALETAGHRLRVIAPEAEQVLTWTGDAFAAAARASALLDQPEPEVMGPTDQELLELMPEQFREDLATVSRMAAHGAGTGVTPGLFRVSLNTGALAFARAVLARWGHQPAPAADGEVAELVAWLRMQGEAQKPGPNSLLSDRTKDERHAAGTKLTRAADLLERQAAPVLEPALARINDILNDSGRVLLTDAREALELARQALEQRQTAPVPVPVAERLPGLGDCDGEGYCWRWNTIGRLWARQPLARSWYEFESHWLPATALPLPATEAQP